MMAAKKKSQARNTAKNQPKRGRPPKHAADRAAAHLHLRLTHEALAQIRAQARAAGQTVTAYVLTRLGVGDQEPSV